MAGNLYAVGCLLIWGISLGCIAVMVFMPGNTYGGKFPFTLFISALIVAILIPMNLASDNPDYLGESLAALTLLAGGVGFWKRRYQLLKFIILFSIFGALSLFVCYFHVDGHAYGGARYKARLIALRSTLKYVAKNDTNEYSAGKFDVGHPLLAANPDLKQYCEYGVALRPCWHTGFTGLGQAEPLPPPDFRAGTLADNLEFLLQYIDDNTRLKSITYPARAVFRTSTAVLMVILLVVILVFLVLLVIMLFIGRPQMNKARKEFLQRPPTLNDEFLRQCEIPPNSHDAEVALMIRKDLASYLKVPPESISGECTTEDIFWLLPFSGFEMTEFIINLEKQTRRPVHEEKIPDISGNKKELTVKAFARSICENMEKSLAKNSL